MFTSRPSWDEYFIELCKAVARRATCDRGRNGCVIVRDKRILCTGYVDSTAGLPHCDDAGHMIRKVFDENGAVTQRCVRTLHAEQNAIIQAAKFGVSIDGATLYTLMTSCFTCAKMLVNAGVKRVVCKRRYHADKESIELFKQAGVELKVLQDEVAKYPDQ